MQRKSGFFALKKAILPIPLWFCIFWLKTIKHVFIELRLIQDYPTYFQLAEIVFIYVFLYIFCNTFFHQICIFLCVFESAKSELDVYLAVQSNNFWVKWQYKYSLKLTHIKWIFFNTKIYIILFIKTCLIEGNLRTKRSIRHVHQIPMTSHRNFHLK